MYRAAVIQMTSSDEVTSNLKRAQQFIAQAASTGVKLIVLPENFACMPAVNTQLIEIAEVYSDGPIQTFLQQQAQQYNVWLVGGTLPLLATEHKVTASCLMFDPHGVCVARYDKMHLFDVQVAGGESYCESAVFVAGDQSVWVDTPLGRIGLSVCYDLRFPTLFRKLALQGCDVIACPAAFTQTTGAAHWQVLVRARAIENLCYVLAANQTGEHAGQRQTYGHSFVVEPWGDIIANCDVQPGIAMGDIDLARLQTLRDQFPCLQHERE
ncbi:MAG: carbon-nitrogen hydrolase family protein [Legionellales bacterium]|nr:carbon-nitrogen hydrolase family protein [Legionellales bacterium]